MGRSGIEQLLFLLDEAFEGEGIVETGEAQSLMANLNSVGRNDWLWVPSGGGRSIFAVVSHVGECKYVYENHAFGDGSMRWDRPGTVPAVTGQAPMSEVLAWLREAHSRFRSSVAALDDDSQLARPRSANWGAVYETRWLISTIIQHDLYHAGEINHIRALRHGTDSWTWQSG